MVPKMAWWRSKEPGVRQPDESRQCSGDPLCEPAGRYALDVASWFFREGKRGGVFGVAGTRFRLRLILPIFSNFEKDFNIWNQRKNGMIF